MTHYNVQAHPLSMEPRGNSRNDTERNQTKALLIFHVADGGIKKLRATPRPASRRNGTSIRYWR